MMTLPAVRTDDTIASSDSFAVQVSSPNLKLPCDSFGELNVVRDDARGRALQEIDQIRLQHTRPRPSADGRRVVANARLVDLDEDDVVVD